MTVEDLKNNKKVVRDDVRKYLTNKEECSEDIDFHFDVPDELIYEIICNTKFLNEYLKTKFKSVDYNLNSKKYCHLLSTLYVFLDDTWKLVQGEFDFTDKENKFYHSWLEKDEYIYDLALNVITLKQLYKNLFVQKYIYNKEQTIELFKRTATFTYYEEDLKNGLLNQMGFFFLYDTDKSKNIATKAIDEFDLFCSEKRKKSL